MMGWLVGRGLGVHVGEDGQRAFFAFLAGLGLVEAAGGYAVLKDRPWAVLLAVPPWILLAGLSAVGVANGLLVGILGVLLGVAMALAVLRVQREQALLRATIEERRAGAAPTWTLQSSLRRPP